MNILLLFLITNVYTTNSIFNYTKIGNGGCREGDIHHLSMSFHIVNSQLSCEQLCSNNPSCTGIEWFIYKPYDINCQLQESIITSSYNNTRSIICLKKNIGIFNPINDLYSGSGIDDYDDSSTTTSETSPSQISISETSTTTSETSTSQISTSETITTSTTPNETTSTTSETTTSETTTSETSTTTSDTTTTSETSTSTTSTTIDIRNKENNVNDSKMQKEKRLRKLLFSNYTKLERPVLDFGDNIKLKYGIEIKSLEKFDQKAENIEFNLWITQLWNDEYLKWNITEYEYNYMNIYSDQIWIPDLELYNAASQPIIYDSSGGMKLFSNGDILWIRPTRYSFSCTLDLKKFPFDIQECTMTFGSWKYNANFLDLRPFNNHNKFKNISVNPQFSHNEWNIIDTYVIHEDIEYLCCPGELWPNSFYTIVLKRNYTKYMVVIAMTLLITIASLSILTFSRNNYTRTFVLVFLPLSIIWLQVYISSKIPVIEYYTLMEKLLITCFIITIMNALESAFMFIVLNEKYDWLKKMYNYITEFEHNDNYIKNKFLRHLKIIDNDKDSNKELYKNLIKHVLIIDNSYKIVINSIFIIIISILLK